MSITVDLGRDLEDFVTGLVRSGRYETHDAVVQDAVRLIQGRVTMLADIDSAIARGLDDIENGRIEDLDSVRTHVTDTLARLASSADH